MVKEEVAYITKDKQRFSTLEEAKEHEAYLLFDIELSKIEKEIKITIVISTKDRLTLFQNRELIQRFFNKECARY